MTWRLVTVTLTFKVHFPLKSQHRVIWKTCVLIYRECLVLKKFLSNSAVLFLCCNFVKLLSIIPAGNIWELDISVIRTYMLRSTQNQF